MIDIVFDLETNDPDDLFTLILLAGHPQVNLKAVTIMPGAPDQVGLVRYILSLFNREIPVGVHNINDQKPRVSAWYYSVYGNISPSWNAESAHQILLEYCNENTTLLTGGPLRNIRSAINYSSNNETRKTFQIGRWFAQGGFAGEGVVPNDKQLEKFRGLQTCPTHNFGVDPKSAHIALNYPYIGMRYFVSKNVCHRVYYDQEMHEHFEKLKVHHLSLELIWKGMDAYLHEWPEGKKFHDPLAACCAIDTNIGTWAEVNLYQLKGEWGAQLAPGSNTWITIDYDHRRFLDVLTQLPASVY